MILFSYTNGTCLWGIAIFMSTDLTEIPLNISRFANEIESLKNSFTILSFVALIVLWIYCRIYVYFVEIWWIWLITSYEDTLIEPTLKWTAFALISILGVMHIFWAY